MSKSNNLVDNLTKIYMESVQPGKPINMNETKIIYVVYEEDRGYGTTIVAAYTDKDKAEEHSNQHRHYYYDAVELK